MTREQLLTISRQIAPYLRVSDDRMEVLSGIDDSGRIGAVFYGIVTGTPPAELVSILGDNKDTGRLFMEYQKAMIERSRKNDEIYDQIAGLDEQVKSKTSDVDKLLKMLTEESLTVHDERLKEKDEMIWEKERQIKLLEKQLEKNDGIIATLEKEKVVASVTPQVQIIEKEGHDVPDYGSYSYQTKPGFRFPWQKPKKRTHEAEMDVNAVKYRDEFLLSEKYNKEQKDFFMDCLEMGVPFDLVKHHVASPGLTAEHMRRIMEVVG